MHVKTAEGSRRPIPRKLVSNLVLAKLGDQYHGYCILSTTAGV